MIEKINNSQIPEIYKDASAKQVPCSRTSGSNADASLQVSYEFLLEQAQQEPVNDANVVERARQMLMSGELDSPENIRKAAEIMLKFGV